jgi:DNA-binding response OmpR family regulator
MEDARSRKLEAFSAHTAGLEAALAHPEGEETIRSIRRLTRSLARAARDAGWPELASLARTVHEAPDGELLGGARDLLGFLGAARSAPEAEKDPPPLADHTVLLVEDSATVAAAMRAHLAAPGRTVLLATTAAEAQRALGTHPIDLVVLDLILPDRDGRDLLLLLREDPRTAAIPVIVVSAQGGAVARAECLAVGASEFLEKPVDPSLLRAAVARHVAPARKKDADARIDSATGLLSRAGLVEAYRSLRLRTGRVEAPPSVAVLALDPFGRSLAGGSSVSKGEWDRLVRGVADHLASVLGERDRLGRWSEADLVAILFATSPTEAKQRLEDACRAFVAQRSPGSNPAGEVSLPVGVAAADMGADLREVVGAALCSLSDAAAGTVPRQGAAEASPEERRPARVLLVEDDRVTATLIHHRLVREGFDVVDFLNGEDAYRWALAGDFDVAILDVKVPGMDGFEILRRFRATPRLASAPVIVLTSLGRESDVVRGLELGANDYMLKPFSPTELLARVRRLALGRAPERRPVESPARAQPVEHG